MKYRQETSPERANVRKARAHVLINKTDAQIENWIDNNVTDLQSARTVLAEMLKLQRDTLRYLAKLRDRV